MGHTIQAQTLGPAYTHNLGHQECTRSQKAHLSFLPLAQHRLRLPASAAAPSTAQEAGAARLPPLAQKAAAARTTGALSPDIPLRLSFLLPHPKPELQGSAVMISPLPFSAPPRI